MRQHIYASNAMKNIYYHLFISDDEGGEDKDCSQDNFFLFYSSAQYHRCLAYFTSRAQKNIEFVC